MKRALALAFVLAGVVPAAADPKAEAKVHIDKATAFHAQNKFADALAELEAAYAIDPVPGLLYAMAQVQVKLDRCADAIPNYQKFIAAKPGDNAEDAAREAIAACKAKSQPVPEPTPQPKPAPVPEPRGADPTPPQNPERPAPAHRAWYADPLGGVLTGTGIAAGVVGVVFYRKATADIDAAGSADNYGSSESLVDRAASRRRLAMIAGAGGGALVLCGVIRYVMVSGREQRTVAVVPTTGGAAVTYGGRW